jgi:puromycin-sensitive aminopeptidase
MAREYEAEGRAGKPIDPALAAAAVNIVAVTGDAADYERYVEVSRDGPTPQAENRYLFALPLFRDPALFERTLASALDGDVRTQNAPFVLAYALTNRDLGRRAWEFIKENWAVANTRFPQPLIVRMVDGARYLTKPGDAADASAFFNAHPIPQSRKNLEQLLERQGDASALRERAAPALADLFGA